RRRRAPGARELLRATCASHASERQGDRERNRQDDQDRGGSDPPSAETAAALPTATSRADRPTTVSSTSWADRLPRLASPNTRPLPTRRLIRVALLESHDRADSLKSAWARAGSDPCTMKTSSKARSRMSIGGESTNLAICFPSQDDDLIVVSAISSGVAVSAPMKLFVIMPLPDQISNE